MSSTTRLLVLGVVRLFQPVHGYEVRRELITWRAQEWASVQPGSIYNALKTLTRDGFLEVVGTDQVGGRPERTSYQLTAAGIEEFRILLREEWWTVRPPTDPLMAAISFIGYVSRSEAIAALEHRMQQIHSMVRSMEYGIEEHDGVDSPFHVREMMRLMNARVLAEIEWAKQFIARLKNGEYATADDPAWQPRSVARGSATRPPQARATRSAGAPRRNGPARGAPAIPERSSPGANGRGASVKRDRNGRSDAKQAARPERGRRVRGSGRGSRRDPVR